MIQDAWLQKIYQTALWLPNPWGLSAEQQQAVDLNIAHDEGTGTTFIAHDFEAITFDPSKVRAFPQFTIGLKDLNLSIDGEHTPHDLSRGLMVMQFIAQNFVLGFDTNAKADSAQLCNTASEIFLHNTDAFGPLIGENDTREYEIMVWVDSPLDETISRGDNLLFTGTNFKVYTKNNNSRYIAFVMDADVPVGYERIFIHWSKVLEMAVALSRMDNAGLDPISDNYKVFGIETGIEIWGGKGVIEFQNIALDNQQTMHPYPVTFGAMEPTMEAPSGTPTGPTAPQSTVTLSDVHPAPPLREVMQRLSQGMLDSQYHHYVQGQDTPNPWMVMMAITDPIFATALMRQLNDYQSLQRLIHLEVNRLSIMAQHLQQATEQMAEGNGHG